MASARKKLDEKHLKILRELVSQPGNKHCFDCNQRGPTYVNVTIGSFVCTSCSGLLRGINPPHRVKSISMATYNPEEIDFIKSRGNEYCKKVWLGLCDAEQMTKDEQQIKDFMIAKYEKKRYYIEPTSEPKIMTNGTSTPKDGSPKTPAQLPSLNFKSALPNSQISSFNLNSRSNAFYLKQSTNDKSSNSINTQPSSNTALNPPDVQPSFANFDDNPVFSNPTISSSGIGVINEKTTVPPPPSEDRYAALKDLDCLRKSQLASENPPPPNPPPPSEWGNNLWSGPSVFNSQTSNSDNIVTSNPFAGCEIDWNSQNTFDSNPFKTAKAFEPVWPVTNGQITNGFPTSQSLNFGPVGVTSNPFKVSNDFQSHHSSNPFL